MAYFADQSPCNYFGDEYSSSLRAVGWLELGMPFSISDMDRRVYERLKSLRENAWQPSVFMGLHGCDLCRFEPETMGYRNLFIPASGFLFVCPEMIVHYINAHGYAPPAEFCDAVLACPEMNSMAYRKALLANGGRAFFAK